MHSRDEQRSRSSELEPSWHALGNGSRACWPTDPDGGGTWVGVHESGLYLGLLNLNLTEDELDPAHPPFTRTRGLIIPELIGLRSVGDAVDAIRAMDLLGISPFRLAMLGFGDNGQTMIAVARFDGVQLTIPTPLSELVAPVCLASSGLGDELVQCRLPLFNDMVGRDSNRASQRAFHRHQWGDRSELSVMMSRPDARTSSVTRVEAIPGKCPKIEYEPIAMGDPKFDPIGAGMLR